MKFTKVFHFWTSGTLPIGDIKIIIIVNHKLGSLNSPYTTLSK